MKNFLFALLCMLLILGLLSGCNNTPATDSTGNTETFSTETEYQGLPYSGTLILNAGGSVEIYYDEKGEVVYLTGISAVGNSLANQQQDVLGKSCSEVISNVITASADYSYLGQDAQYVMLRPTKDSPLPDENFLNQLAADIEGILQEANILVPVILFTDKDLDENGYITTDAAQQLLLAHLMLDDCDTIGGTPKPINGEHAFVITYGVMSGNYIVDAVDGTVFMGILEGSGIPDANTGLYEEYPIEQDILDDMPQTSEN